MLSEKAATFGDTLPSSPAPPPAPINTASNKMKQVSGRDKHSTYLHEVFQRQRLVPLKHPRLDEFLQQGLGIRIGLYVGILSQASHGQLLDAGRAQVVREYPELQDVVEAGATARRKTRRRRAQGKQGRTNLKSQISDLRSQISKKTASQTTGTLSRSVFHANEREDE